MGESMMRNSIYVQCQIGLHKILTSNKGKIVFLHWINLAGTILTKLSKLTAWNKTHWHASVIRTEKYSCPKSIKSV